MNEVTISLNESVHNAGATLIIPTDNDLHLQTQDGEVVVSSRYIAEKFDKEHRNVIRDIENLIGGMLKIEQTPYTLFKEVTYQNEQNKQYYREILMNRKGFSLLAMGFTGDDALKWKIKYNEAFEKMERMLLDPYEGLSKEVKAILMQDKKIQQVESRVNKLEDNIHITRSQQKDLNDLVRTAVFNALGGKYSLAYKEFGKKAFSACWKDYKNAFNIASYLDTPTKDFQAASNFINAWKPGRELDLLIRGSNMEAQNIG